MGRLVDADVLMEYFKRLSDECSSENNYEYSNLYDCVCAEIMTEPTAYDVEKVVAELEKEKEIHTEHYNISLYKDYPDIKQRYEQIQLVIDNAIAKVKKGGAE